MLRYILPDFIRYLLLLIIIEYVVIPYRTCSFTVIRVVMLAVSVEDLDLEK